MVCTMIASYCTLKVSDPFCQLSTQRNARKLGCGLRLLILTTFKLQHVILAGDIIQNSSYLAHY